MTKHFDIRLHRQFSEEEKAFDDYIVIKGENFGLQIDCYLDDENNQMIDIRLGGGYKDADKVHLTEPVCLICEGVRCY